MEEREGGNDLIISTTTMAETTKEMIQKMSKMKFQSEKTCREGGNLKWKYDYRWTVTNNMGKEPHKRREWYIEMPLSVKSITDQMGNTLSLQENLLGFRAEDSVHYGGLRKFDCIRDKSSLHNIYYKQQEDTTAGLCGGMVYGKGVRNQCNAGKPSWDKIQVKPSGQNLIQH